MSYELVISVLKGGAFMRYRVGDMYQCIDLKNKDENIKLPRFKYLDRVPNVIDIGGFTRITENFDLIKLSNYRDLKSLIILLKKNLIIIIVHICIYMLKWIHMLKSPKLFQLKY